MTSFSKEPLVSVIIPCSNEEKFLAKCLDSISNQDFPKENLEVLVIDGASEDKTKEIAGKLGIKVLDNPKKYTPFGLNIGIKNARGEIIIRMDAHADYPKDYISKCVKYLKEFQADNVGGIIKTIAFQDTPSAKAIAYILADKAGAASSFRLGSDKIRETDTVFGGCYQKEVFKRIGFFDERMLRSQDIELNKRLKKSGGKIILVPDIYANYHPQATLSGFLRHNFQDGFWVIYPLKFGIRYFSLRHLIPLFFTGTLIFALILGIFSFWGKLLFVLVFLSYLFLVIFVSLKSIFKIGINASFLVPLAIFIRHFGYGFGSLWGLIKLIK